MHHKVAIYDGSVVQTGSFNWTDNASCCSWENALFIGAAEVVGQVRTLLDNLTGEAFASGPDTHRRRRHPPHILSTFPQLSPGAKLHGVTRPRGCRCQKRRSSRLARAST